MGDRICAVTFLGLVCAMLTSPSVFAEAALFNGASTFANFKGRCQEDLASSVSARRATWNTSHFTHPETHSDSRFRYIIHAMNQRSVLYSQSDRERVSKNPSQHGLVDLFEAPQEIWKKWVFSASVVDQNHKGVFGTYGLILDVPSANLLLTSPRDLDSRHGFEAFASKQSADRYAAELRALDLILPPETLLSHSHRVLHNEVILQGETNGGERVKVIGIFASTYSRRVPPSVEKVLPQLRRLAEKLSVPLVFLPTANAHEPSTYE